jgi:hypothetical protein
MEEKPRLVDDWMAVSVVAQNWRAIKEFGAEEYVRRALPDAAGQYGFDYMVGQVNEIMNRGPLEDSGNLTPEDTEILDKEDLTPEDLEDAHQEELVLSGRVVIMSTLDIDTERAWELNNQIREHLGLFYSFERPYRLLKAAIDPESADFEIDDEDILNKTPAELFTEVIEDPTLFEKQRDAAVEIARLLAEYGEEVQRWMREEGLDQLAAEQATMRLLTEHLRRPARSGKKEQRRLEQRAKRRAKRKGKKQPDEYRD